MNLIGKKVKNKISVVGEITDVEEKYITIAFPGKIAKFPYDSFGTFINAIDADVQEYILSEVKRLKEAEEEKKRIEKERKEAEAAKKAAEEEAKRAEAAKKTGHKSKPATKSVRVEGKRMVFWVFQGNTFEIEAKDGYIWAPIYDQAGNEPHHWKRLLDVREGDIILHGCDGMLKAISVAQGSCFDCIQPKELEDEKLWGASGRMVKCEYEIIDNPIKTSNYKADIIKLPTPLYAPFDKNGNGNMGYLYEIDPELVKIFVSETIKKNPKLASVAHITSLI